ncbi:MAG: DUF58 domain-containing protein [Polyangiaceae bacterium]
MVPSLRLILLLVVPALLSLLALADASLMRAVWMVDGAIALLALLDALSVVSPLVWVSRKAPAVLSVGRPNRIPLTVRSRSRRTLEVLVNEDLFESSSAEGLPARVTIAPFASQSLDYFVTPTRRGAYQLGNHYVRYPSLLGLWRRQLRVEASHPVRVYPDLQQLRVFELMARQNREYEFVRATRRRGGETEFARLRDYSRDDEYRSIDWKATARRQKLTAREYQLESNQEIVFVLDGGRLMTAEVQGLTQFDHALNAALMLGHVAIRTGDQVGLLAFDDALRAFVPPVRGRGANSRLIQAAYDLHPRLVESDYEGAFRRLAQRQRKRALVIIFTQVLDDQMAKTLLVQCRELSRSHLPLVVPFRDLEVEALLEPRKDRRNGLYIEAAAAEILRWRASFVRDLRHGGALVLDVAPKELTPRLINFYFEIKSRHWL